MMVSTEMPVVGIVRKSIVEQRLLAAGQTVVVAVSGGADSLCLLHVLWRLRQELGVSLHVAHLDHGLRGEESAADARFVAEFAAGLGLPATVEARDVTGHQRLHHLTPEEAARDVRYRFLAEVASRVGAGAVATGHTADDNVETLVLHWLRGAGLAGMRGILPSRPLQFPGFAPPPETAPPAPLPDLVRPLLGVTRAQTEGYCLENALPFRKDATNDQTAAARNRIRLDLLPELERYNPRLRETLLRASAAASGDYDYLRGQILDAWPSVVTGEPDGALALDREAFRAQHPAIQRGILREALERLWGGWQDFGWAHVEDLRRAAVSGRVGSRVDLPHGLAALTGYTQLRIGTAAALSRLPAPEDMPWLAGGVVLVSLPGVTTLPGSPWELVVEAAVRRSRAAPAGGVLVDADAIGGVVELRGPRPGDRLEPTGMTGSKKLQDLFVDAKVPREMRAGLAVLAAERGIFWVAGRWAAGWAVAGAGTRRAWRFSFRRRQGWNGETDPQMHDADDGTRTTIHRLHRLHRLRTKPATRLCVL